MTTSIWEKLIFVYRWSVVAVGAVIIGLSVQDLFAASFQWKLIPLLAVTYVVASKISIKLKRYNGVVGVADTFIFLALLLWGAPAAVVVAAAEAIASSAKVARRLQTYFLNVAVVAISIWTTGFVLEKFFAPPAELVSTLPDSIFIMALGVMSLTHYFISSSFVAGMQILKMPITNFRAWMKQYYLWSCVTFFVAAAAAGAAVKFIGDFKVFTLIVIAPIIILIYFTYRTYLHNLDALQESEARFRSSFDYATVGMALVATDGYWLEVNQSLRNLLEYKEDEMIARRYSDMIHPEDAQRVKEQFAAMIENDLPTFQHEVRLMRSDNEIVWTVLSASTARDAQNSIRYLIFQTQDITLRKKAEKQLLYDASHDVLTGLQNRAAYTAQLKVALERAKRNTQRVMAILFLDLDGFKMINDSLGHATGDELLKTTAARLLQCVRAMDTVARLGGDEFTILLEDLDDVRQALRVAERIKEKLAEPFQLAGQEIFISTSVGIATSEISYREPGEMLRDADAAMYQAKAQGKSCYVLFDHEMHATATRQLRLANDLRRAGERDEFVLHYQAVQSLETEQLCGFEALMRWNHPRYGLLMPSEFIPLAEENGLTGEIDRWALVHACRDLRDWQLENPAYEHLLMSVNVSTKQFTQNGLYDFVKQVLIDTNVDPRCLQLEVTESAMVQNLKNTARILEQLHDLGVVIALDDFGTGYSSLSYLHELPIDTLKIDRSFVSRLSDEAEGAAIVRAIIVLARNLRIKVIAEGVETLEQFKHLRGMGCEFGQGYLFSRPVPLIEAHKLLTTAYEHLPQMPEIKRSQFRLVSGS